MSELEQKLRDNYIRELSKRLDKESKERGVAVSEFEKELKKRLNEEPLDQFTKKEINALKNRVAKLAAEVVEQKLLQEITKIVLDKVLPELDRVRLKKEVPHDHTEQTLRPDKLFPTYCALRTAQIDESQITDLVHDATKIQGKTVDVTGIGDNKILTYKTASGKIEYDDKTTAYTDAEAVLAVEAEATLDLTGKVTVDHVGEKTGGHYVAFDNHIDVAGYHLLFANTLIKELNANYIKIRTRADNAYRGLYCSQVITTADFPMTNNKRLRTATGSAKNFHLSAWDVGAGAQQDVATVQGHATDPFLNLLNAKLPLTAPATAETGKFYYDSATDELRIYDGAAWQVH